MSLQTVGLRAKRVRAGACTQYLTVSGSKAAAFWKCHPGFHAETAQGRVHAAKAVSGKTTDGASRHHRHVITARAEAVWEGYLEMDTLQPALRAAAQRLGTLKRPWARASDVAATFVLTLVRLGSSARSARPCTTARRSTFSEWRQRRWPGEQIKQRFWTI